MVAEPNRETLLRLLELIQAKRAQNHDPGFAANIERMIRAALGEVPQPKEVNT